VPGCLSVGMIDLSFVSLARNQHEINSSTKAALGITY